MDILAAFAFSLFDLDDSKTLESLEISNMVKEVYGGDLSRVANVLQKMEGIKNEKGLIERVEFVLFSRKYPLLLFPAFSMQQALRRNILGESYWEKITELRNTLFLGMTIFDIIKPPPAPEVVAPVVVVPQTPVVQRKSMRKPSVSRKISVDLTPLR